MIFARWTNREKIITKCCSDLLWVWPASANPRTICRFTSSRLGTNAFVTREKLLQQSNPACREMENEWKWWYNVCTFAPLLHSKNYQNICAACAHVIPKLCTILPETKDLLHHLTTQSQHTWITWCLFLARGLHGFREIHTCNWFMFWHTCADLDW